ncbi:MAG: hypothetical protein IJ996_00985 [Clostridia bacterium]|nr:hypothetical protein [Clostridia bacterium]
MKKIILTLLISLFSLICLCACETTLPPEEPPVTNPPTTEERGDPDFPGNAFDKDNEVAYPDAWK